MDVTSHRGSGPPTQPLTFDEKRMELTEHLGELRSRILWSILFLVLGAIIAYQFFSPLYGLLYRPLAAEMHRQNMTKGITFVDANAIAKMPPPQAIQQLAREIQYLIEHPTGKTLAIAFKGFQEPFLVRLKISIIYGFILVLPLVVWQLGMFVTPALTPEERRPLKLLLPISIFLLIFGVLVAYFTMYYAIHWFLSYLDDFPQPSMLIQDPNDYILFFVKMMAAFGIAFQLPVVMMGGAFVGLITSKGLIKHWRWGIMIAALGALFTPSNDIFSMVLMAVPLLILYAGSIVLVRFVERMKARQKPKPT